MTNTRVEHLPETEKKKHKSINPLQNFIGVAHDHAQSNNLPAIEPPPSSRSASGESSMTVEGKTSDKPRLSLEEYFSEPKDKSEYDGELVSQMYMYTCTYTTDKRLKVVFSSLSSTW